MIQLRFIDDYYNLTLKDIAFLRWTQNKCSDAKYIMKRDDGIIVNVEKLVNNSKSFKSGITGILIPKRKPDRTIGDMWYILRAHIQMNTFPTI